MMFGIQSYTQSNVMSVLIENGPKWSYAKPHSKLSPPLALVSNIHLFIPIVRSITD